jgi:hypothetical protein
MLWVLQAEKGSAGALFLSNAGQPDVCTTAVTTAPQGRTDLLAEFT